MKNLILITIALLGSVIAFGQDYTCVDGQHTSTIRVNAQGMSYVFPLGENSGPEVKLDTVFIGDIVVHHEGLDDATFIVKKRRYKAYEIVKEFYQEDWTEEQNISYLDEVKDGINPTQNNPDGGYVYGYYWLSDEELKYNNY